MTWSPERSWTGSFAETWGFGKTEVALRAVFKAVMDGRQVAWLVPTTVLAQQHYNNFLERMKDFPVTVEMLSRFQEPGRAKADTQGRKVRECRLFRAGRDAPPPAPEGYPVQGPRPFGHRMKSFSGSAFPTRSACRTSPRGSMC